MARRVVALNENGRRIGEDHPNAKLSNHDVDLILELRERYRLSYRELAAKFEVSKSHVRYICKQRWRSQCAMGYRTLTT